MTTKTIYDVIDERNFALAKESFDKFLTLDILLSQRNFYSVDKLNALDFIATLDNPNWDKVFNNFIYNHLPTPEQLSTFIQFFKNNNIDLINDSEDPNNTLFSKMTRFVQSTHNSQMKELLSTYPEALLHELNNNDRYITFVFSYLTHVGESISDANKLVEGFLDSINTKDIQQSPAYDKLVCNNNAFLDSLLSLPEQEFYKYLNHDLFLPNEKNIIESTYLLKEISKEKSSDNIQTILEGKIADNLFNPDTSLLLPNTKKKIENVTHGYNFLMNVESKKFPVFVELLKNKYFEKNYPDLEEPNKGIISPINQPKLTIFERFIYANLNYLNELGYNNEMTTEKRLDFLQKFFETIPSLNNLGLELEAPHTQKGSFEDYLGRIAKDLKVFSKTTFVEDIPKLSHEFNIPKEALQKMLEFLDNRYNHTPDKTLGQTISEKLDNTLEMGRNVFSSISYDPFIAEKKKNSLKIN